MGSSSLNFPYLIPRLARHFLPEKLVRTLLLRNVIIRPGLETSNPFAAVQRYVDVLSERGLSLRGKRVLVFGYGGRFDLSWTLGFFLPVVVPLLFAYLRPGGRVRASWRLGVLLLLLMAAVPPLSMIGHRLTDIFFQMGAGAGAAGYLAWGVQLGCCLLVGTVVLLLSLSDPRWAAATVLLVLVPLISEFLSASGYAVGLSDYSGVLMLAMAIPAGARLRSLWARRRAVPRRA